MSEELLVFLSGVTGQDAELQVIQPDKFVSIAAGETATLRCLVTSLRPVGPVKWFQERLGGWEEIYNYGGKGHYPRVTNASDSTKRDNVDFSIRIHDISPADMGTYYCVKFRKGITKDVEFKSGPGTQITVNDEQQCCHAKTVDVSAFGILSFLISEVVALVQISPSHHIVEVHGGNIRFTQCAELIMLNFTTQSLVKVADRELGKPTD
ncbi:signal-regulatory protein beta-1-like [Sorex araneus]|uniref:signal-regulatory protein beta-1-like n=1 Tax=Sorex araneus TaxID=42254 RepID=UPI002433D591|nr:signal-regulatory protein beta-1-like [Sorex araneus]